MIAAHVIERIARQTFATNVRRRLQASNLPPSVHVEVERLLERATSLDLARLLVSVGAIALQEIAEHEGLIDSILQRAAASIGVGLSPLTLRWLRDATLRAVPAQPRRT
jgi:hypothetical protein